MTTLSRPQDKQQQKKGKQKINPLSMLTAIMIVSLIILFSIGIPSAGKKHIENSVTWECVLCNYIEEDSIGAPKLCPKCKKRTLYPTTTFKCVDCGTIFEGYKTIIFYDRKGNMCLWELLLPSGQIVNPMDPSIDFRNNLKCPSCNSAKLKSKKFLE